MDQGLFWFHQTSFLLVLQSYPDSIIRHLSLYFLCSYLVDFATCTNYRVGANIPQISICLFEAVYHFYVYLCYKKFIAGSTIGSVAILKKVYTLSHI